MTLKERIEGLRQALTELDPHDVWHHDPEKDADIDRDPKTTPKKKAVFDPKKHIRCDPPKKLHHVPGRVVPVCQ